MFLKFATFVLTGTPKNNNVEKARRQTEICNEAQKN